MRVALGWLGREGERDVPLLRILHLLGRIFLAGYLRSERVGSARTSGGGSRTPGRPSASGVEDSYSGRSALGIGTGRYLPAAGTPPWSHWKAQRDFRL